MNKLKCGQCHYYDVQFVYVEGKRRDKKFGRCAKRSLYPAKARDGQVFPEGVARADEGELIPPEKVLIVREGETRTECLYAIRKKA